MFFTAPLCTVFHIIQVLDEEESSRDNDEDDNSELSPTDYSKTESSDTASYSDYGSYKLPSFDGKFCKSIQHRISLSFLTCLKSQESPSHLSIKSLT